jgi:hypothetical protein
MACNGDVRVSIIGQLPGTVAVGCSDSARPHTSKETRSSVQGVVLLMCLVASWSDWEFSLEQSCYGFARRKKPVVALFAIVIR